MTYKTIFWEHSFWPKTFLLPSSLWTTWQCVFFGLLHMPATSARHIKVQSPFWTIEYIDKNVTIRHLSTNWYPSTSLTFKFWYINVSTTTIDIKLKVLHNEGISSYHVGLDLFLPWIKRKTTRNPFYCAPKEKLELIITSYGYIYN